jgi:hypothetical protein
MQNLKVKSPMQDRLRHPNCGASSRNLATCNRNKEMRIIESQALQPSSFIAAPAANREEETSVASLKVRRAASTPRHKISKHLTATHLEPQPGVIRGYFFEKCEAHMLEKTRSRAAEFYFNGACLVRALFSRNFRKIPFFLQHLWCAVAR